jgi:large subunit ribosomal protein L21
MSKITNPKAWYLVGVGVMAVGLDGARRLIRRRRRGVVAGEAAQAGTAPAAVLKSVQVDKGPSPEQATAADDLTTIKGIGPTYAKRLADSGITTFAGLANASTEHLRDVTHATAAANPKEWIAQAREK